MSFRSFGRPVKTGELLTGNKAVVYQNKPGMSKYETTYLVKEESDLPPYWRMYGVESYKELFK